MSQDIHEGGQNTLLILVFTFGMIAFICFFRSPEKVLKIITLPYEPQDKVDVASKE